MESLAPPKRTNTTSELGPTAMLSRPKIDLDFSMDGGKIPDWRASLTRPSLALDKKPSYIDQASTTISPDPLLPRRPGTPVDLRPARSELYKPYDFDAGQVKKSLRLPEPRNQNGHPLSGQLAHRL